MKLKTIQYVQFFKIDYIQTYMTGNKMHMPSDKPTSHKINRK